MAQFTGRTRASAAIKKAYYKKLMKLIDAMDNSVKWWLEAEYKRQEDKIISDVSVAEPRFGGENSIHRRVARERKTSFANINSKVVSFNLQPPKGFHPDIVIVAFDSAPSDLNEALKILFKRWSKKFDAAAEDIATWFADEAAKHSNRNLQSLLTRMGFTVKLNLTTAQRTKLKALVLENVNLIKSIPQKYFTELTTVTMQSVSRGRDLDYLRKEIQKRYGVAKDRAVLIARDQNNKATSIIIHDKYEELGIKEAVWKHNSGAKDPRASHLKADGKPYDINKGMFIDGKHIYPGEEINCGCTSVPIIPGLNGV